MRRTLATVLGLGLSLGVPSWVLAQPKTALRDSPAYAKPKTANEFWRAIRYEITLGKYEIAADLIKAFLESNPSDNDLVELYEGKSPATQNEAVLDADAAKFAYTLDNKSNLTFSIPRLLELRNVPRWVDFDLNDLEMKRADVQAKMRAVARNKNDLDALKALDQAKAVLNDAEKEYAKIAKQNQEGRENAEKLIGRITVAIEKMVADPVRIRRFVSNLVKSPEERQYAQSELIRTGAKAIPVLVSILSDAGQEAERNAILETLPFLNVETVPPLLASFDIEKPELQANLLNALAARQDFTALSAGAETNPIPTLCWIAGTAKQPGLRTMATNTLERLKPNVEPKAELVAIANQIHAHQLKYPGAPQRVPVWRIEDKGQERQLTNTPAELSQAEEYFGLRFARWALQIDPSYVPAQVAFLSIAADKAMERGGLDKPLAEHAPQTFALLSAANSDVLMQTFEKARKEGQTRVLLAITQVLAARGERAAGLAPVPTGGREVPIGKSDLPYPEGDLVRLKVHAPGKAVETDKSPVPLLVRALDYADRRVQLTAAEALLSLPIRLDASTQTKAIEVLRRALAGEPERGVAQVLPKALIGDSNALRAVQLSKLFRRMGYDTVIQATGRDVLRRLNQAADIDLVVLDHQLPYPQLPNLLGQLRADYHYGLLPVFVLATGDLSRPLPFDLEQKLQRQVSRYTNVRVMREPFTEADLKPELELVEQTPSTKPLSEAERKAHAKRAIVALRALAMSGARTSVLASAEADILRAVRSPDLAKEAIDVAGRIPNAAAQTELAVVLSTEARPPELRVQAADTLARHIQAHGILLQKSVISNLQSKFMAEQNPMVKGRLAAVLGAINPPSADSGSALRGYNPPLVPPAAKPAAPAPMQPPADNP